MPESVRDRPTSAHEKLFLLAKQPKYFFDADAIREPQSEASLADHLRRRPSARSNGVAPDRGAGDRGLRQNGVMTSGSRNRRNVWTIATQPYPEAHFATFPTKLVEPCVLAGSSPRACGECRAPWKRVVEDREVVSTVNASGPNVSGYGAGILAGTAAQYRSHGSSLGREPPRTTGWQPSCAHDDDSGRCVVLDPFAGSGTVGVVALRHDRSFIGIELNAGYCELARRRIADDAPLLNERSK